MPRGWNVAMTASPEAAPAGVPALAGPVAPDAFAPPIAGPVAALAPVALDGGLGGSGRRLAPRTLRTMMRTVAATRTTRPPPTA